MATVANGVDLMSLSPFDGEKHMGSINIQTAASRNLVLTASSSFKRLTDLQRQVEEDKLYQAFAQTLSRLIQTSRTLADLASSIASLADHAYDVRRLDIVASASQLILSLPSSNEVETVGRF